MPNRSRSLQQVSVFRRSLASADIDDNTALSMSDKIVKQFAGPLGDLFGLMAGMVNVRFDKPRRKIQLNFHP